MEHSGAIEADRVQCDAGENRLAASAGQRLDGRGMLPSAMNGFILDPIVEWPRSRRGKDKDRLNES